jgi:hypothetical protein
VVTVFLQNQAGQTVAAQRLPSALPRHRARRVHAQGLAWLRSRCGALTCGYVS